MSSNIKRIALSEEVSEFVDGADLLEAFAVLTFISEQHDSGREITLDEALMEIRKVAAQVEAIG